MTLRNNHAAFSKYPASAFFLSFFFLLDNPSFLLPNLFLVIFQCTVQLQGHVFKCN